MENLKSFDDISRQARLVPFGRIVIYGAVAGFIATWSISTALAASEMELRIPVGTFYAIMGISFGLTDPINSVYMGFGAHLVTGTILGSAVAVIAVKIERIRKSEMTNVLDPYRAIPMGVGTGILVWLVLFVPVTLLFVQPSEERIDAALSNQLSSRGDIADIGQSFTSIAISAVLFHAVWGAIFGFILSSLVRIKVYRMSNLPAHSSAPSWAKIASYGLAAGLISSLAMSGLILLAEETSALPAGTFYYVLVSALLNWYSGDISSAAAIGLVMHLVAGSIMGLAMSIPFMLKRTGETGGVDLGIPFVRRFSPIYGLAFGFGIWLLVFVPISYIIVLPILNSFENEDVLITQRSPTGGVSTTTFFRLTSLADQVLFGALAFNMLFGLLVGIIIQSFYEKRLKLRKGVRQDDSAPGLPGDGGAATH